MPNCDSIADCNGRLASRQGSRLVGSNLGEPPAVVPNLCHANVVMQPPGITALKFRRVWLYHIAERRSASRRSALAAPHAALLKLCSDRKGLGPGSQLAH